jgi:Holliday junction resolvase RusA-like endonuclease
MVKFEINYKVTGKEGLNKLYAGSHWAIRKKKADYWHQLVQINMKKQLPKKIFKRPVIITIRYNTRLDIDNHGYLSKLIIDGMKGYLIEEDSRKYVVGLCQVFHEFEKDKIIIEVQEID